MKKKVLSIITALTLCLSLLPTAALAEGDSTEGYPVTVYFDNTQARWDTINAIYDYGGASYGVDASIFDANESAEQVFALSLPETAMSVMFRNYITGQPEDTLPNGYQNTEWLAVEPGRTYTYVPHICKDSNGDHYCDSETCGEYMSELCTDTDNNHSCDVCNTIIPGKCVDEAPADHYCDTQACRNRLSDCEDESGDKLCELCGQGIYPKASELNVEAQSGDETLTITWDALYNVGEDAVASYTVYCYEAEGDMASAVTETYAVANAPFEHTFTELTNGVTYAVGVCASYPDLPDGEDSQHNVDLEILATPFADLYVGGIKVTEDNADDVLGDDTVSYNPAENTLVLDGANITAGYPYREDRVAGIYTKADLNIEVVGTENQITAPAGSMSRGIYAKDLFISGNGMLTVVGGAAAATDADAESVGIYAKGGIIIYEATVIAKGGSAVVTGGGSAHSNGVYTEGDLRMESGGGLIASGGEATGKNAYSTGVDAYGTENTHLNIAIYDDSYVEFTGGTSVGEERAGSNGIYGTWAGLYVYDSDAHVTLEGGEAESVGTSENAYAYSNGAIIHAGDVNIDGGTVNISGGQWSGPHGDGYALYVATEACKDEAGETYYSGGSVSIDCEDVTASSYSPSLIGTRVTIAAENAPAVYAEMGFNMGNTLTIAAPDGAEIKGIGGSNDPENWVEPDYWTVVNAEGAAAERISIEPLGYTVFIRGLRNSMAAQVPAGKSLNETYCEMFGIADFSEVLPVEKEGYSFRGWYTDEACTSGNEFTFDDEVNSDITIYPKWTKKASGSSGSSNTSSETTKNEDGSTTTTTTNKTTGVVTETTKTTDGVTGTVVTDKTGEVTEVSSKVPAAAAKGDAVVTLPLNAEAADHADKAVAIKVDVPSGGATVEIPVENVTPGTVAVMVNADGTEEIIKTSSVTEDGVVIDLEKDATVKIIDNSKNFADVHDADHWASDAVDFVAARGIFGGTAAHTFNPNGFMTRQAMWMVLARMSGAEPANMDEAKAWAVETGISDGSNPTLATSRQQFVTMLWRWAQSQDIDVSVGENTNILSYEDAFGISEYAIPAFQWACGAGVVDGYADNTLKPEATASRAHVAKMLMNFLNK